MKLGQSVLFAHQEETLSVKSLLFSDLLLRDSIGLLGYEHLTTIGYLTTPSIYRVSCEIWATFGCLLINSFDVSWHFELVKDKLPFNLRLDLSDDSSDLEALVRDFLQW